ncbi:MAG TPA: hypothetical protein VGD74_09610 [Vulgatibacter sp.]
MRPAIPCALLLCGLALHAAACAAAPEPKSRLLGVDSRFPTHLYVVGVGEGESEAEATRRAYAAIAMQLQAELEATERVEASSVRSGRDGGTEESESLAQEIQVRTRFNRTGWIRVAEVTPEGGRVRVLCVLDRDRAGAELEAEIEEDLARLRPQLAALDATTSLGSLSRGIKALRADRASLQEKLALRVALGRRAGAGATELRALRDLEARLEALRRTSTLQLCVSAVGFSSGGKELVRGFGASMAATGWAVVPCQEADAGEVGRAEATGNRPGLRLDGTLRADVASHRQAGGYPWFCATSLVFEVVDPGTGRAELGGTRRSLRSGGMTAADACRASLSRLAEGVAAALDGADHDL